MPKLPQLRTRSSSLVGELTVPGDKSITHRALFFAALCNGTSSISGISGAQDCESTIQCLQQLGLRIEPHVEPNPHNAKFQDAKLEKLTITAFGLAGLKAPTAPLYVGNSGTTIRLLSGLLAGRDFECTLDGDESIRRRPMHRVIEPLKLMGTEFTCLHKEDHAPFKIKGCKLHPIDYVSPVASAQVETAFLLAALQADGISTIELPCTVRDHTTKLFSHMGIAVDSTSTQIQHGASKCRDGALKHRIKKLDKVIPPFSLTVPGDISSAAYFMVAATLLPGSDIFLPGVGVNPGRTLIIDALRAMGAQITIENMRRQDNESIADIHVKHAAHLNGVTISGAAVPLGIDEIPILALAGCFCEGTMSVRNAAELRHKESDRLQGIVQNLRAAGVDIKEREDGFDIIGNGGLSNNEGVNARRVNGGGINSDRVKSGGMKGGSQWQSYADHRLAMTGLTANLLSDQPICVDNTECIGVSYPSFQEDLRKLMH